jgi:predicted ABC-type ATPase
VKQTKPRIIIVAGPNGSGKTTFARNFLPDLGVTEFVNADLIAAGLSPFDPSRAALQAGKLMLELIEERVRERKSFGFETTLSGRNYARRITSWRDQGFAVQLMFLRLPSADMAVERVRTRVCQGGHNIAEDVIRRRFDAGLFMFETVYKQLVDKWTIFDNSGPVPFEIARSR